MVELLAPAGNLESLKQAVFGGANAVYFGAKNFNARKKADNFDNLQEIVSFCHSYGVKAYLTLNTLIENDEIEMLIETCKFALECNIDAFIVQDFGVLHILKNVFNNVEIHASTQMAVNNYLGALKLQEMGVKRVVLARETSLLDIKLIKQKTNLEVEYFVQGALCVCFSGNCYLSSHLFNKSGNKGECLQPCRLPYKAYLKGKFIKSGYLLSAKDLCFAGNIKDLIDAGVDSFKIEGRLRRPAYVGGVTKIYRQIIDNNNICTTAHIENLKKLFNRGDYTLGYLNGNGGIIDENIQGHKGVLIGSVTGFKSGNKFNVITIKTNHILTKGDGLKFIKSGRETASISAIDIKKNGNFASITTTAKVNVNDDVYLILDKAYEDEILKNNKKLPLNLNLIAKNGQKLQLYYNFKNIFGSVYGDICVESKNQPILKEQAKEQLQKLNDTNFYLNKFIFEADNVFVRKQELNSLRRNAIDNLLKQLQIPKQIDINMNYVSYSCNYFNKPKVVLGFGEDYKSTADFYVIKPKDYINFDYSKIEHSNTYLYIPSFLRNEDIMVIDEILKKNKKLGVYAENIGALGYNRKTILGAKLNIKNVFAIKELVNYNVELIVASPEISDENFEILNSFTNIPVVKASFTNFDLMTLVHCPIKMLFNSNCNLCKYSEQIEYEMENGVRLKLNRYKVKNCYFTHSKV